MQTDQHNRRQRDKMQRAPGTATEPLFRPGREHHKGKAVHRKQTPQQPSCGIVGVAGKHSVEQPDSGVTVDQRDDDMREREPEGQAAEPVMKIEPPVRSEAIACGTGRKADAPNDRTNGQHRRNDSRRSRQIRPHRHGHSATNQRTQTLGTETLGTETLRALPESSSLLAGQIADPTVTDDMAVDFRG